VAAHLSIGASLKDAGEALDPAELARLEPSRARIEDGPRVIATVARVDGFGNLILDLAEAQLPESGLKLGRGLRVEAGGEARDAVYARTFADADEGALLLYLDSAGSFALAVNRGSATESLGVVADGEVVLSP